MRLLSGYLVLAAAVCTAGRARAAEWWVDQAATAGGDGSAARPFRTINEAKGPLATGDTIFIKGGTYRETVDFWHVPAGGGSRTTVRAAPGEQVIIDGGRTDSFVLQAGETPDMTFQDLVITNGATGISFYQTDGGEVRGCITRGSSGSVSFYFSSHGYVAGSTLEGSVSGKASDGTVLENNEIYGSGAEGITLHADSKNCRYSHNVVHDNTSVNIYLDSISNTLVDGNLVYMTLPTSKETIGIMLADESYANVTAPVLADITITNNVVLNCESGIRFWDGEFPGQSALRNVLIANNTVLDNATTALKWDAGPHQNTRVVNNVFAGHSANQLLLLQANSTTGVALDHNLWSLDGVAEPFLWGSTTYDHPGWVTATSQGSGDVLGDPLLAGTWSLPVANLKLSQTSPALDQGVALAQVATDFDGAARPAGFGVDIGAFELGATASDGGAPVVGPNRDAAVAGGQASKSSGCSCRLSGQGASPPALFWAAFALGIAMPRRRRQWH
jgi:MYXO-CTERM domain-containing protein